FVERALVVAHGDEERKWQDNPVQQAKPKAGCHAVRAGTIFDSICSGGTASGKAHGKYEDDDQKSYQGFSHGPSKDCGGALSEMQPVFLRVMTSKSFRRRIRSGRRAGSGAR